MALPLIETPQERVRTALHLLDELEHELGVVGLIVPQRYHLVRVLATTRRQLWLAVATLEFLRGTPRSWVRIRRAGRKRGWSVTPGLAVVAWAGRAFAFVLNSAWRYMWAIVRLMRTWRVLWP